MAILEIPTEYGHDVIEFDRTVGADHPAVKAAMQAFNDLIAKGARMATKTSGDATIVTEFDKVGERTFAIPQRQGG